MNSNAGYWISGLIIIILISGCVQQENVRVKESGEQSNQSTAGVQEPLQIVPNEGLGTLCSNEEECSSFCLNNTGRCKDYCQKNTDNTICQKLFPIQIDDKLENQRPVLSLPFHKSDEAAGILPMGETISHNGEPHAGMDFFWEKEAKIVASVDGEIVYIDKQRPGEIDEGVWDIFVRTGKYVVGYTELSAINMELHLAKTVKKGEWLGNSWNAGGDGGMIHWEFGYYPEGWQMWNSPHPKPHPERLCPMTYFDEDSKQGIEVIWKNTNYEYRDRFSQICSGIYEGKDE